MAAVSTQEWLVVIPDHDNALEKRLSVRPKHFEGLKPKIDSGDWVTGGALLHNPMTEGKDKEFKGSFMVARASSEVEVLDQIKNDIYATEGVWDVGKVQIYPIATAFRNAL